MQREADARRGRASLPRVSARTLYRPHIIEGLLRNLSDAEPDTIHADTQGQSYPVHALAHLFGFDLLPRIRNWKDLAFYRPAADARYAHIDSLFGHVETPYPFYAVGQWYADFTQVSDDEVTLLLARARAARESDDPPADQLTDPPARDDEVTVPVSGARLAGRLTVPEEATGLVLFAHGSGSGRHSPRNRYVANVLNQAGLGTLLFDLLTPTEEFDRANVFDIELLAGRLVDVTHSLAAEPGHEQRPIGYFGASTGAAAALVAAAEQTVQVSAVVSRGGRPDLAGEALPLVQAPTLLIVGSRDWEVLELNRSAQRRLRCLNRLEQVPGATHLFEEPGTLHAAAELAPDWFLTYLTPARPQ